MNLSDYIEYDAIGLAQLISGGQVSAHEVQQVARQAIEAVNPALNALVGELFDGKPPTTSYCKHQADHCTCICFHLLLAFCRETNGI
jgi:Asp-tRNA(Asn)/Glu-tRNA(Gln) amidotransferase A subunit family amidase